MAIDPSIPLKGLMYQYDPSVFQNAQNGAINRRQAEMQMQDQAMERQAKEAERQAYGQMFSGPGGAMQRPTQQTLGNLARQNGPAAFKIMEHFQKLDANGRKLEADKWQAAGPVLARLKTVPAEQRGQFIQQAFPQLAAAGWTQQELMNVDLSDQSIDALSSAAMTVSEVVASQKPDIRAVTDGGSLWNLSTPGGPSMIVAPNPGDKEPGSPVGQPGIPQPGGGGVPRGIRNNNPLNLEASNWTRGQDGFAGVETGGRFATFKSPEAGMQAAQQLLGSYVQRGFNTPQAIINRWAPQSENGASTANYVKFVSDRIGVKPGDRIGPDKLGAMARAMSAFENGYTKPVNKAEVLKQANAAIKRGKDPKAVQQRLREMGIIQ